MTFVDRPLPAGLELPKLQHRGTQNLTNREGRVPGVPNKITRNLREGIIDGAEAWGSDGAGKDGLSGYLCMCAGRHPKAYLQLLSRVLPQQQGYGDGVPRATLAVNIVSIESGSYLSHEDCQRLKGVTAGPVEQLELTPASEPQPEPEPEFVPQGETERRLLSKLESMTHEQLLELAKAVGYDRSPT